MTFHSRSLLASFLSAVAASLLCAGQQAWSAEPGQRAQASELARPTTAHINELGPENGANARSVGLWDVTETVWASPGAVPIVTRGLVAERWMIGSMLEESLKTPLDPDGTLRVDYLTFNRVEGRWEYVSMDTRAAVGMMTGQSYGRGDRDKITIIFQPFSVPGPGPGVAGQMLRMRQDIIASTPDRAVKDQYFTMADGAGVEWLAHRYAYVRR